MTSQSYVQLVLNSPQGQEAIATMTAWARSHSADLTDGEIKLLSQALLWLQGQCPFLSVLQFEASLTTLLEQKAEYGFMASLAAWQRLCLEVSEKNRGGE